MFKELPLWGETYDLVFTGRIMAKIVQAHVVFLLEALYLGSLSCRAGVATVVYRTEDEVVRCNLLRHDIFVMSSFSFLQSSYVCVS